MNRYFKSFLFLEQDDEKGELETVTLRGTEQKAIQSVLKYLEPPDNTIIKADKQTFQRFEDALDSIKTVTEEMLIKYDRSNRYSSSEQQSKIKRILKFNRGFSASFVNLLSQLLPYEKSTVLICISLNTGFTKENIDWILKNADVFDGYDVPRVVFTDCACKCVCQQQIPKEIRHIIRRPPIYLGYHGGPIGWPLFLLKYTGDSQYGYNLLRIAETVTNLQFMFSLIFAVCPKSPFPFRKWRCFNGC